VPQLIAPPRIPYYLPDGSKFEGARGGAVS
jgi:hypothetical protein